MAARPSARFGKKTLRHTPQKSPYAASPHKTAPTINTPLICTLDALTPHPYGLNCIEWRTSLATLSPETGRRLASLHALTQQPYPGCHALPCAMRPCTQPLFGGSPHGRKSVYKYSTDPPTPLSRAKVSGGLPPRARACRPISNARYPCSLAKNKCAHLPAACARPLGRPYS